MRTRSWFVCLGLLAGCAPPVSSTAYLMVDRDAREVGYEIETSGWRGAPMLPLALGAGEAVELRGRAGSLMRLHPAAGRLTWLRGELARADEVEADTSRLILDGTGPAVHELARLLDARLTTTTDDTFGIEASELFERTSYLEVPEGIREARPEASAATTRGPELVATPPPRAASPSSIALVRDPGLMEITGIYVAGDRVLVIDTDGRVSFIHGCEPDRRHGALELEGSLVLVRGEDGAIVRSFVRSNGGLVAGDVRYVPLEEVR